MHRNDKSKYLLYIEPKKEEKLTYPINDELTSLMELALSKAEEGSANYSDIESNGNFRVGSGYRGSHRTEDGKSSDNHDYLLENGLITNSLCVYYVKWYRNSIHDNDWMKLKSLADFYGVDIDMPDKFYKSDESTKMLSWEENLKMFEEKLVDELSRGVNERILNEIRKLKKL